jgi:hypothetical protein
MRIKILKINGETVVGLVSENGEIQFSYITLVDYLYEPIPVMSQSKLPRRS